MLSHQRDLKTGDFLVIDEVHLMSGTFRNQINKKLINLIQQKNKTLLLQATQQSLVTILKTYIDIRYVKIKTEKSFKNQHKNHLIMLCICFIW
jgi:hypothetical protein